MQEASIYTGAMLMDALHDPEVAAEVAGEHEGLAVMVIGGQTVMVDTTQWDVSPANLSVVTHEDGRMTIERVSSSHAVDWPGAGRRAALTQWYKGTDGKRQRDLVTVIGVVLVERDASSRPATLPPRFEMGSDILRDLKDLVLSAQVRVAKDHSGDLAKGLLGVLEDMLQQRDHDARPVAGSVLFDWNRERYRAHHAR